MKKNIKPDDRQIYLPPNHQMVTELKEEITINLMRIKERIPQEKIK